MNILFIIIFSSTLVLLIFNTFIYNSLNRLFRTKPCKESSVKISVIIAAKNEEKNIPNLIDSLQSQSYDSNLFEVIIVDDNSTDNTFNIAKSLTDNLSNFKVLQASDKKYEAKKGTLDFGITQSLHSNILITDADCTPSVDWIMCYADKFDNRNEIIFGIAPFVQLKNPVNKIACFENLRSQMLMFGFANFGMPYSASARSFGFTKAAFETIGGYENINNTLSGDDDLLLQEGIKNKLKIGLIVNRTAFVQSNTKIDFSDYFKQKARHTSTSLHYLIRPKLILSLWHISNLLILFSSLLIFLNSVFILPVFIKFLFDIFMVNIFQKNFGYKFNLIEFIILQIIYEIDLILFFFSAKKYSHKW